jgi:Ca2+-binding EF-hand superfamily protein
MISDFDLDMNGTIDFNEFLRILHSRPCDMDTKP